MSLRPRTPLRGAAAVCACSLTLCGLGSAHAATPTNSVMRAAGGADRTEQPIASRSPQSDVRSSVVSLRVPLPAGAPPHPAACDWIQYERFRAADGPDDPMRADAVAVLMPGLLEGATAFDPVARNTIEAARAQGRHIEVWAIDRRANCLEDHAGVDAAEEAVDPQVALDYYYRGRTIAGARFGGFTRREPVLRNLGLAQTINDYDAVLTRELPDQAWREHHVICGGHSLGGPLTRAFASWDFDGDPRTTADAGYRQCAGFFGFDTVLAGTIDGSRPISSVDPFTATLLRAANLLTAQGLRGGLVPPYIDLAGIGPETEQLLEGIGAAADLLPNDDWTPLISQVPHSATTDQFFHLTASTDIGDYLLGHASMRDYRFTNLAALGQSMDDNAAVFGLVRASFGIFDGTPLMRNRLPGQVGRIPLLGELVTGGAMVLPRRAANGPLIGWRSYDQLGDPAGQPWAGVTSPAEEVTDAHDFARIVHEGPLDLTEHYFPTRLLTDAFLAESGDRSGALSAIDHPDGITAKPRFVVLAGNGMFTHAHRPDPYVLLPGYEHLDVLTAAQRQNDGRPERSSQAFARFIEQTVPLG